MLAFLRALVVVEEEEGLTNADTTAEDEVSRVATTEVNFMVCGQVKLGPKFWERTSSSRLWECEEVGGRLLGGG